MVGKKRVVRAKRNANWRKYVKFLKNEIDTGKLKVGKRIYTGDKGLTPAPQGFHIPTAKTILRALVRTHYLTKIKRGVCEISERFQTAPLATINRSLSDSFKRQHKNRKGKDKKEVVVKKIFQQQPKKVEGEMARVLDILTKEFLQLRRENERIKNLLAEKQREANLLRNTKIKEVEKQLSQMAQQAFSFMSGGVKKTGQKRYKRTRTDVLKLMS